MDLARLPNDKKLQLCKWYFKDVLLADYRLRRLFSCKETSQLCRTYHTAQSFAQTQVHSLFLHSHYPTHYVGCLLLPFVWAVNAIWFFKEAFIKPPYDEQKQIKKYVLMSAAGAIAWIAVFAVWITIFQLQRVSWGSTGDALSFIVPLGRA